MNGEFRHVDHPYRDDLVVHVPCGSQMTLSFVPEHRCNPRQSDARSGHQISGRVDVCAICGQPDESHGRHCADPDLTAERPRCDRCPRHLLTATERETGRCWLCRKGPSNARGNDADDA